ncbi:hypothetical protein DDE18_07190 [Nocardioides gansuensis]|uniref:GerMN domain-containing protein n=1 Tax=Nocardioides gansuensis TaxID=2138300 RepID=A0A2T8FBN2_9ACTN|nr:LpqB family beta-propeller domain-containing protein [Nocardioides gansuensis]PVG83105.1 hypothetical protein DDE18_07190 [Nocardioides gansuensis]
MTRALRLLVALLLLAGLAGCVRMPSEGPVEARTGSGRPPETPRLYFDPRPPQPGETPSEIVTHFLEAMTATPIKTSVARQFLSTSAQEAWRPEKAILTYAEAGEPLGDLEVAQPLAGINRYDDRGAWQGRGAAHTLRFAMVQEDGEWRIDRAPDAVIVPEGWFADWYQRVSLHFFDPTAQILVPEPVYVPVGDQSGAAMVRGLLADPSDGPQVARTFFPPGFDEGLSVPITPGGIAEVTLSGGDPGALDEATTHRMLAQLVWTLRQDPRVSAVQVTVGDRELGLPGGPTQVRLDVGAAYDPTGAQATGDLFGLLDGRLVRGSADGFEPTAGPLGAAQLSIRSVGVDLAGERAAAVAADGRSVLVAPVDDGEDAAVQVVSGARDLLPPHWDFADRLWLVDRNRGSARVQYVVGERSRRVAIDVPGITGRQVRHFLVSRDGSRLVAVVRTRAGDRVRVSRLLHDERGRVLRATRARGIAPGLAAERISDLGWRSPTAVSVLINDELSQVRTVSVEGAPEEVLTPTRLRGRTSRLVTSPVEGAGVYAVGGSTITDMASPDLDLAALPDGMEFLTYVG